MGALTLKRFPFEIRGWDVEKFFSIDLTDSFGCDTQIYINKNQIIQIEPSYDNSNCTIWLTDKSRLFFDSIFVRCYQNNLNNTLKNLNQNFLYVITKTLINSLYFADQLKKSKLYQFFTIVFENVSIEVLSLLITINKKYSFINLKRAENINKNNNDLEESFQISFINNKHKLANSTLCLLISSNCRYESYLLNLKLKQRISKGNFKCFNVGSLIDLTFPIIFLGSNNSILKPIFVGNNLICQTIKNSINPLTICNNEIFKRADGNKIIQMINVFKYKYASFKIWNNLNIVSNALCETGVQSLGKFPTVSKKDLESFGTLYYLNVSPNSLTNLKQIICYKLLNYKKILKLKTFISNVFIDQSLVPNKTFEIYNQKYLANHKYFYLPSDVFYENEETFINIEGLVKKTTKVIFRNNTVNSWQILRKILKRLKKHIIFIDNKNNSLVFLNLKNLVKFKNFTYFQYQATQSLTNLNFYLNLKSQPFNFIAQNFKFENKKIFLTKLKYWLEDFYTGGKDGYCTNSFNMINCSKVLRSKISNFF